MIGWTLLAGFLGLIVGLSELLNRYKSFTHIFKNIFSWLYMIINLVAGMLAYIIIHVYKINLGPLGSHQLGISLFSGLGAMAFLRSSFFTYKDAKEKVIEIGPAILLSVFLKAAERQFDQLISKKHIQDIDKLMRNINFLSASKDLPLIILASMRVLNDEEQKLLSEEILKLVNDTTTTTEARNIAMGAILIKYTGIELLTAAVNSLTEIYNSKTKPALDKINQMDEQLKKII